MAGEDDRTAQRGTWRPTGGRPSEDERLTKVPPVVATLSKLAVSNASSTNVTGARNWVVVRKAKATVIIEATTGPKNTPDEWKAIKWSGGTAVLGHANRRQVSCDSVKKQRVSATVGGTSDFVDIWILWVTLKILTSGTRPSNAAGFGPQRDGTDRLGPVTYEGLTSTQVGDDPNDDNAWVQNRLASGKIVAVATLAPKGVGKVVKAGWMIHRQVFTHNWSDGVPSAGTTKTWTPDSSNSSYLRLTPDAEDRIFDTDAPDMRNGLWALETYNNFRQWVEWNGERCSNEAPWFWRARWLVNRVPEKQVTLNEVGTSNITLPSKPTYTRKP